MAHWLLRGEHAQPNVYACVADGCNSLPDPVPAVDTASCQGMLLVHKSWLLKINCMVPSTGSVGLRCLSTSSR